MVDAETGVIIRGGRVVSGERFLISDSNFPDCDPCWCGPSLFSRAQLWERISKVGIDICLIVISNFVKGFDDTRKFGRRSFSFSDSTAWNSLVYMTE